MPEKFPKNKQLFYTIEILDEAISKNKKVCFRYNEYGTDKKLYPRKNSEGNIREYIVNPYQMAATNGRYYLICNYDKYDKLSNYRIDRISDIKIIDENRKPLKNVVGGENGLNLPKHMAEHIYMFTGDSIRVEMKAKKYIVNDLIDWFGQDIVFKDETDDCVTVVVTANETAMRKWCMQYALHVKIISPLSLSQKIKEDLQKAMEFYCEE